MKKHTARSAGAVEADRRTRDLIFTPADLQQRARALLNQTGCILQEQRHWIAGPWAVDANLFEVGYWTPRAVAWCAKGLVLAQDAPPSSDEWGGPVGFSLLAQPEVWLLLAWLDRAALDRYGQAVSLVSDGLGWAAACEVWDVVNAAQGLTPLLRTPDPARQRHWVATRGTIWWKPAAAVEQTAYWQLLYGPCSQV